MAQKENRGSNPNSLKNLKPIYSGDDERIKKAHTAESCAKQSESLKKTLAEKKRKRQLKEDIEDILSLNLDSTKEEKTVEEICSYDELLKANTNVQVDLMKTLFKLAKNGDLKAVELLIKIVGGFAPEEINTNVKTEGQSTMESLLANRKNADINKKDE